MGCSLAVRLIMRKSGIQIFSSAGLQLDNFAVLWIWIKLERREIRNKSDRVGGWRLMVRDLQKLAQETLGLVQDLGEVR